MIATPYAKKLAKEMGIDLANIGGSGPNGRITASDVESAKNGGEQAPCTFVRHKPKLWVLALQQCHEDSLGTSNALS